MEKEKERIIMKITHLSACIFLSACTQNLPHGTQEFVLRTEPEVNARCELNNNSKRWVVEETPSSIEVLPNKEPLKIDCYKGNLAGTKTLKVGSNMFNTNLPVPILETINDVKILATGEHWYYYILEVGEPSEVIVDMKEKF